LSPKRNKTTTNNSVGQNDRYLLGCKEIAELEVIRVLGEGQRKIAFEVKLPWGEQAVVKRCKNYTCTKSNKKRKEAKILKELQEQYGDEAAHYFGECDAPTLPMDNEDGNLDSATFTHHVKKNLSNFSVGYTAVIELGKPLLPSWKMRDRKCFAEFLTERDIEDIRNIARRYANFSKRPLLMGTVGHYSDNIFAQQYMTSIGGGEREGRIHHIDLDMVITCKDEGLEKNCTADEVLEVNCQVMAYLSNIPNLDCSFNQSSILANTKAQVLPSHISNYTKANGRINAAYALGKCTRRNNPKYDKKELAPKIYWPASSCVDLEQTFRKKCPPPSHRQRISS